MDLSHRGVPSNTAQGSRPRSICKFARILSVAFCYIRIYRYLRRIFNFPMYSSEIFARYIS